MLIHEHKCSTKKDETVISSHRDKILWNQCKDLEWNGICSGLIHREGDQENSTGKEGEVETRTPRGITEMCKMGLEREGSCPDKRKALDGKLLNSPWFFIQDCEKEVSPELVFRKLMVRVERPWSMHRRDGQESVGPQEGCQVRERVRGPRARPT